jgi:hypothetical protein
MRIGLKCLFQNSLGVLGFSIISSSNHDLSDPKGLHLCVVEGITCLDKVAGYACGDTGKVSLAKKAAVDVARLKRIPLQVCRQQGGIPQLDLPCGKLISYMREIFCYSKNLKMHNIIYLSIFICWLFHVPESCVRLYKTE